MQETKGKDNTHCSFSRRPTVNNFPQHQQDYVKMIKDEIRFLAYTLAEKDGFKETSEYYWLKAEMKTLYYFK